MYIPQCRKKLKNVKKNVFVSGLSCCPPPYVENADVDGAETRDGVTRTFLCHKGHRFPDGQKTLQITCDGGEWSLWPRNCLGL